MDVAIRSYYRHYYLLQFDSADALLPDWYTGHRSAAKDPHPCPARNLIKVGISSFHILLFMRFILFISWLWLRRR